MDSNHPEGDSAFPDLFQVNLVGRSPMLRAVVDTVRRVADHDVTVAIYGETGTGKELVARALHYTGSRSANPFIPVNCGALTDSLFESELFGHERGAFTDASREHAGLIEQARSGTLFLDEIEALSPRGQVALLRFLQDKSYRKVGGTRQHTADVRVIVASNVPPEKLHGNTDRFRDDLYYRLNVLPILVPSLRERREDIALLAQHFLTIFKTRFDLPGKYLGQEGMAWLLAREWPGNVRELENTLQRGLLLAEGREIEPRHLQVPGETGTTAGQSYGVTFDLSGGNSAVIKSMDVTLFGADGVSELAISSCAEVTSSLGGTFLPQAFLFVADGNQSTIEFFSTVGGFNGLYIDNVTVTAVPVPPAAGLFGAGLLGLIGLSRCSKAQNSHATRQAACQ